MSPEHQSSHRDVPLPKPRFSLRWLLIATSLFAIIFAAIFNAPDAVALPILVAVFFATPVVLVVGVARGRFVAYLRAFSIGVVISNLLVLPYLVHLLVVLDSDYDPFYPSEPVDILYEVAFAFRLSMLIWLFAAPALGLLCVGVRWSRMHADVSLERSRYRKDEL